MPLPVLRAAARRCAAAAAATASRGALAACRRRCSASAGESEVEVRVPASGNFRGGTFTYKGPAAPFANVTDKEFYECEELHNFFTQLGVEVYLPDKAVDDKAAAPSGGGTTPATRQQEEEEAGPLPPTLQEAGLVRAEEMSEMDVKVDGYVWQVKESFVLKLGEMNKARGEPATLKSDDFDMYVNDVRLLEHKTFGDAVPLKTLDANAGKIAIVLRVKRNHPKSRPAL